jgi:hypothetical protein
VLVHQLLYLGFPQVLLIDADDVVLPVELAVQLCSPF